MRRAALLAPARSSSTCPRSATPRPAPIPTRPGTWGRARRCRPRASGSPPPSTTSPTGTSPRSSTGRSGSPTPSSAPTSSRRGCPRRWPGSRWCCSSSRWAGACTARTRAWSRRILTATAFGWVKYARLAMMDAPMALGLALAAYGTWRASEEDDPPWLLAVGVAAAMDFLIKGPVGAVLVLLLSGGFLLVRNRRLLLSRWTARRLPARRRHRPALVRGLLRGPRPGLLRLLRRLPELRPLHAPVDAAGRGHAARRLPGLHAPLDLPLPRRASASLRAWREPGVLLPLAWMAAVLVTFTIPSLKWPHYGLTAIPAAMLLVGARSAAPLGPPRHRRHPRAPGRRRGPLAALAHAPGSPCSRWPARRWPSAPPRCWPSAAGSPRRPRRPGWPSRWWWGWSFPG